MSSTVDVRLKSLNNLRCYYVCIKLICQNIICTNILQRKKETMFYDLSNPLIQLFTVLLIVLVTLFGTQWLKHCCGLPKIIGYVLAGLLIGPSGLGIFNKNISIDLAPIIDVLIGVVFYELGRRIHLSWVWRQKKVLLSYLILVAILFFTQLIYLLFFDVDPLIAWMVSAIVMSTSPAVILQTIKENKAEGQLTEHLLSLVALGNVLAYLLYSAALSLLHFEQANFTTGLFIEPIQKIVGSILVGWLLAIIINKVSNFIKPDIDNQHLIIMTALMMVIILSGLLKMSVLTCLLCFGLFINIHTYKPNLHMDDLGIFSTLAYVLIFIFAGININIYAINLNLIGLAIGVIVLRLAVPYLWGMIFYRYLNINFMKVILLCVSLAPLSGIAILMLHDVGSFYPELSMKLNSLLVIVVLIMEFAGPVLIKWALVKSGEGERHA